MKSLGAVALALLSLTSGAWAADTPLHTIAVAGEAELLLKPDYATVELGVVSQAPLVEDALADNGARMTRVLAAVKALGIADTDLRTSTFVIQPKYERLSTPDYDTQAFRTITGYYIANKIEVTVRDLSQVAKIIDESVRAGANASGNVAFHINSLSTELDEAQRRAVANARHKAEVLSDAAHIRLGAALSVTDNEADTSYNDNAQNGTTETVVVTGSRLPTPIEPGLVKVHATVTVLYSTHS